MKMLRGLALTASILLSATGAQAADYHANQSYQDWSGAFVGASIGYHYGDVTQQGCVGSCAVDPVVEGLVADIETGYYHQFDNNYVVGVGLGLLLAGPDSSIVTSPFPFTFETDPKFGVNVSARFGYAMGDTLPYAMLGYQYIDVDVSSGGLTVQRDHHGLIAGLGVERRIQDRWSVDARYTFVHMPKVSYDFGGGPSSYGENGHNLLLGIKYRFYRP